MITTTLNRIRTHGPCTDGWKKLKKSLGPEWGDDDAIPYEFIVVSNGLDDALWCCRAESDRKEWRLFAVWCARQVEHLMTDQRSKDALNVAERHANGEATEKELAAAGAAAWDAAWDAAGAAAKNAAWDAARDAAKNAARTAAWDAQKTKFLEMVS